jgi:hypothetical protein
MSCTKSKSQDIPESKLQAAIAKLKMQGYKEKMSVLPGAPTNLNPGEFGYGRCFFEQSFGQQKTNDEGELLWTVSWCEK